MGDGTLSYVSLSSADIPDNTADTSGNASTATTLETTRTIGGVSFNGSADIDLPGVNTGGNQDTTGTAAKATILETTRTIGGVSFNGSADIDLPGVNTSGNQDTTGTAAKSHSLKYNIKRFCKDNFGDGTLSYVSLSSADIPDNTATRVEMLEVRLYWKQQEQLEV